MLLERAETLLAHSARLWCYLTHPAPYWPIHGRYRCPKCRRVYAVPWESRHDSLSGSGVAAPHRHAVARLSLRSTA